MPAVYTNGPRDFLAALRKFGVRKQPEVRLVVDWALWLRQAKLARLRTTVGISSRALRIELPDEARVMVMLWASRRGVSVGLEGAVVRRRAPRVVRAIERAMAPVPLSEEGARAAFRLLRRNCCAP